MTHMSQNLYAVLIQRTDTSLSVQQNVDHIVFWFFDCDKVEVTVFIDGNTFYDINRFQLMKEVGKTIVIFAFI